MGEDGKRDCAINHISSARLPFQFQRSNIISRRGTNHGTADPMFLVGGQVSEGLYGDYPSLSNLDSNGDLTHTVDFRCMRLYFKIG